MLYPKNLKNRHFGCAIALLLAFVFILLQKSLFAEPSKSPHEPKDSLGYDPLYAGTLLSIYADNAAPGHMSVQPYIFYTRENGIYEKNWSFHKEKGINEYSLFVALETGITQHLDIALLLTGTYSQVGNRHSFLYNDTKVYLGAQLLVNKKGTWIPDLRLLLGETFPTGKYQHLNPKKLGSDISGAGSFQTSFILVTRKIFYTFPSHPFNFNLNLYYILPTKVHVKDFNAYGGGPKTNGNINPGNQFIANLGFEFSFTRYWAIGTDIHYERQDKSPFHGKRGFLADGSKPKVGLPSYERLSLAPCLEYNFNENFSLAWGVWFSVAGRNTESFISGVANVYYYF